MASAIAVPTCNLSWTNRPRNLDTHREGIPQARTRMGIGALKNPRGISTLRMITTAPASANESSPAAEAAVTASPSLPTAASISSLKTELLSAVAGLNRGLVATEADVMTVDTTSKNLEASVVDLSKDLDKLQGRWRLVYSSAFASGSLGGFRPGPPTGRLPLTLGQVQNIK
uniref:Plastid lipid-associated protein/fibrillin conserved domain-containing protein n=1 Tax=Araucaria cunninghamii TaxID=56994 RepID=A0A0D6R652_ARACU